MNKEIKLKKQKGINRYEVAIILFVITFLIWTLVPKEAQRATVVQSAVATTPMQATIERFRKECVRRSAGCLIVASGTVYPVETRGAGDRVFIFPTGSPEQGLDYLDNRVSTGRLKLILPDDPSRPMYFEHYATGVPIKE